MLYIGLDAHSETCELTAVNEKGNIVMSRSFDTSEKNIIECLSQIKGKKTLTFEEGPLASWLSDFITPCVDKVIVSDPKRNRWIGSSEKKDDKIDAAKLANLLRGGYVHAVYHPEEGRRGFKEIVLFYHDITGLIVSVKNKIKAEYRQNGVFSKSRGVYSPFERTGWLSKLARAEAVFQVNNYCALLDRLCAIQRRALAKMVRMSRRYPECALFEQIPGVGPITSATVSAILVTPHRFQSKREVWAYAGLAVVGRHSGNKAGPEHLNCFFNRILKRVVKSAALEAISQGKNPFAKKFHNLLSQGVAESSARLTIARNMLAVMYGMWKTNTDFDPGRVSA
ncbi:MAG: transposase [Bacillota bacterium]